MIKKIIFWLFCFCLGNGVWAQNKTEELLAYQYYQQADYEKAATLLEKLFAKTPNDAYFDLYYNALLKIKKYREAENLAKKLIKQFPQKTLYQIALGKIYQEEGKTLDANKIYQAIIQELPKSEFEIRTLANTFYRFGAYDMAIRAFLQGRKILNNEQLFNFELLSIYRFKKDKLALISEYLNVLPANPQLMTQAQSVLSNVFDDNSDYQLLQMALLRK